MKRYCFVVNPASRGGRNQKFLSGLKSWVDGNLPGARWVATEGKGHASDLAGQAAQDGYGRIVSVGGDGTLHEVVNGVAVLPPERRPQVGAVSTGTGGDFPRTLKERHPFPPGWDWLRKPSAWKIDIGRVEMEDPAGQSRIRFFVNIADVGLSGEVTRRANLSGKGLGSLTYLKATLEATWSYRAPRVRILGTHLLGPTFPEEMPLLMLIVANGRYFGGGMCISPSARLDDGLFSVMLSEKVGYFALVKELPQVYRKKKIRHPKVYHLEGTDLSVETLDGDLPIGMDGEFFLARKARFQIIPQALEILVPSANNPKS